jgi:MtN3 and saliva related transmembrane protein
MTAALLFSALQLVGGVILTTGYIPQIVKILRTHSARDLSATMFAMVLVGVLCYETYAIYLVTQGTGLAFLITNTVSVCISFTTLALILKYGGKPPDTMLNGDVLDLRDVYKGQE